MDPNIGSTDINKVSTKYWKPVHLLNTKNFKGNTDCKHNCQSVTCLKCDISGHKADECRIKKSKKLFPCVYLGKNHF